jgi:hypothetical protein
MRVEQQLDAGKSHLTYWLATTGRDGRPHIAGVGAVWSQGNLYFVSGPDTRKSRDIAINSRCALSASLRDIDLVVEGTATKVTDPATLDRLARQYAAGGWPAEARDGAITAPYSAPSAGPAPWFLYEVIPVSATGVATAEPYGATRWRFDRG